MTQEEKSARVLIVKKFVAYKVVEAKMDTTTSIEMLEALMLSLSEYYDDLIKLLRTLKKEQPDVYLELSTEIITSISQKGSIYRRNMERLDPSYDYDQGGLDENED